MIFSIFTFHLAKCNTYLQNHFHSLFTFENRIAAYLVPTFAINGFHCTAKNWAQKHGSFPISTIPKKLETIWANWQNIFDLRYRLVPDAAQKATVSESTLQQLRRCLFENDRDFLCPALPPQLRMVLLKVRRNPMPWKPEQRPPTVLIQLVLC